MTRAGATTLGGTGSHKSVDLVLKTITVFEEEFP